MSHKDSFTFNFGILGNDVDIGEQYGCHKTLSTFTGKMDSIGGN